MALTLAKSNVVRFPKRKPKPELDDQREIRLLTKRLRAAIAKSAGKITVAATMGALQMMVLEVSDQAYE